MQLSVKVVSVEIRGEPVQLLPKKKSRSGRM
jgi:hypothetical protein